MSEVDRMAISRTPEDNATERERILREHRGDMAALARTAMQQADDLRQQLRGAVEALVAGDLLADAVYDEVPQRTLETLAAEFRAAYVRAGGQ